MSAAAAPSAWQLQTVVSIAQATITHLERDHGIILDTDDSLLAALADEGVNVSAVLAGLIRAALDVKAMGCAAELRIADLRARRERFLRQETAYRETALAVMQALNLKSFKDAEFSLSVSDGKPRVVITEAGALPDALVRIEVVRVPDKVAIKAALELGPVSGATLSNAQPVITVRTK
jgi:hypothetical protein